VSHSHLSVEEVHQIAYLTLKGWTLVGNEWSKDGLVHTYETSHGCGCHTKKNETPYFPLDRAYEVQWELDHGG
jgi:hypothetical protein